jgi:hypothetical protein
METPPHLVYRLVDKSLPGNRKLENALKKAGRSPDKEPGVSSRKINQGIQKSTFETGGKGVPTPGNFRSVSAVLKTVESVAPTKNALTEYLPTKVDVRCNSEDFYSYTERSRIPKILLVVVKKEGPIRFELASKRIAEAYGFMRVGERML